MEYMEMLARLGIGSAHPGGFSATVRQLREHPIPAGSRVLEVGCGTGRTSCYLAKMGYQVTAVDLREDMLVKARRRADAEDATVTFLQGDITKLPFSGEQFDAVLAESVTIFAKVPLAVQEYARVLKPGGVLYDREIIAIKQLTPQIAKEIQNFYGVARLHSEKEWLSMLQAAGLRDAQVCEPAAFPMSSWEDLINYPDMQQEIDPDTYENEAVWETARKYEELMTAYHEYFGFGLMIGRKPG